jgi:hypothetical protein
MVHDGTAQFEHMLTLPCNIRQAWLKSLGFHLYQACRWPVEHCDMLLYSHGILDPWARQSDSGCSEQFATD